MSISTSPIGNYNLYAMKPAGKSEVSQSLSSTLNVTSEEKNFFANLYPDKKQEIVDYHFYERSGKMNGVSLGSVLDRRM